MIKTEKERRKEHRYAFQSDYLVLASVYGSHLDCKLLNISSTGACIITEHKLKKDQKVILHIIREKDRHLTARIVWVEKTKIGISFDLTTTEDLENIAYILNNIPKFVFS